jgi:hypothetical protein
MHTLEEYVNRSIDATLMLRRIRWGASVSTEKAREQLAEVEACITYGVSNYKDVSKLETKKGNLLLLIRDRELWSNIGPFDDCSHWVGQI